MRHQFRSGSLALKVAVAAAGACALVAGTMTASTAADSSPPGSSNAATLASGPDWTVTQVAGGYTVSLTLSAALPVKNTAPDLVVDGVDIGPATESADGKTLSLTTLSTSVVTASSVTWQWATGGNSTATGPSSPSQMPQTTPLAKSARSQSLAQSAGDNPVTLGNGAYTVADYNFGPQSIALANIGGIRGEMQGRIYLPDSPGEHPLVIFQHGRHSSCYTQVDTTNPSTGAVTTTYSSATWPCVPNGTPTVSPTNPNQIRTVHEILSYAGYDAAGEALAKDGYVVVSIGADAINANDNQLAPDYGAVARGQQVLDTLTMLNKANNGEPVSYDDAYSGKTYTLDQALQAGDETRTMLDGSAVNADGTPKQPIGGEVTAAMLKGTMDFSRIGLMGHSRGGEGVNTAGILNEGLAHPWNITSIFALAPIDFTRLTLPDVNQVTLLPYCDGDVSDQQGQHFYADSRTAFNDNVLRSNVWVMGTDHNFYNTTWTPPYPLGSDDWGYPQDSVCGAQSSTTTRLSPADQDTVGAQYVAGWFELTLGGQQQFLSMFDGEGKVPASIASFADVRTVAQQPASSRSDITNFASTSSLIGTAGTATATVCANAFGRTVPEPVPSCTSASPVDQTSNAALATSQQPYWTPARFAPNVPLNQMTHLTWTDGTGALTVTLPSSKRDVSAYSELTLTASPDQTVANGTDMTLAVTDARGTTWSSKLSALNPWTVNRMPGSSVGTGQRPQNLHKLVLQQAHVPTATLAAAKLDLTKIARITLTAATGLDGTASGGMFLSDLGFDTPALGTPSVQSRPTVNIASTKVEEGDGPGTADVAVYLSRPATSPVTAYLSMIGTATGKVGLAMQQVSFAPGQTCQAVSVPTLGDRTAGATASSSFTVAASDPTNAVLGINGFGTVTVREDDGVVSTTDPTLSPLPAVGQQGNVCAEFANLGKPGTLTVSGTVQAGADLTVAGSGYRAGESVDFTLGEVDLGSVVASSDGKVASVVTLPASLAPSIVEVTATGAGSGYTSTAKLDLRTKNAKVTVHTGATAYSYGKAVTGTVSVAGATGGSVVVSSGSAKTTVKLDSTGQAAFRLSAGLPVKTDTITASFGGDASVAPSSGTTTVKVAKAATKVSLAATPAKVKHGKKVTATVKLTGYLGALKPGGSVKVSVKLAGKTVTRTVKVTASGKVSVKLTLAKKGTATITAVYLGDSRYAASLKVTKKVKVS